ncbi:hypothetical protein [Microcoleus sp. CAWBG58]|uniref:hypothetical protein n=1 Tax=Microcoleus sp. CAWBG58 TaxID=2841651 RepID=UPI0025D0D073|nr:hypothetical protein [Microcoleus sp. CAWBG58]
MARKFYIATAPDYYNVLALLKPLFLLLLLRYFYPIAKSKCFLLSINCQLSTVNCQLSTVNCQLSTVNSSFCCAKK